MRNYPAILVIIILGLSSLPLSTVHAQWFERMRAMSPKMWTVRPTGFGLPQTLKNVKPVCTPEPKAANETEGQTAQRRKRFVDCLLHTHEQELNKMNVMMQKLQSRSNKLQGSGRSVVRVENKMSEMTQAISEAQTEFRQVKSEFSQLNMSGAAPELKAEIKAKMVELLNEMKDVHRINAQAVEEIRKSTIEQIQGRTDGRFKKPVTQ